MEQGGCRDAAAGLGGNSKRDKLHVLTGSNAISLYQQAQRHLSKAVACNVSYMSASKRWR